MITSTQRTALIILGMHRSGTSALTRVLSLIGASLPNNLYPPGDGNPLGHWEPAEAVSLNDRMLASFGSHVNSVLSIDERWFTSAEAVAFTDEVVGLIDADFGSECLIVIKDPRISLLFPVWADALKRLNIDYKVIILVRSFVEISDSLSKRQSRHLPNELWSYNRCGLLAFRYLTAAERYTRDRYRVFVNYDDLLQDWRACILRIGEELGVSWPVNIDKARKTIDQFLSFKHRHHRSDEEDIDVPSALWSQLLAPAYVVLRSAAAGYLDSATLNSLYQIYEHGCITMGGYLSELEHRVSQAPFAASSIATTLP